MISLILLSAASVAKKRYSEQELMDGIKKDVSDVYEYLYRKLTPIIYYEIKSNNGTTEDAEDHFQETIVVVAANVKSGKYVPGNLEGYFKQVSKNLWLKKLRDGKKLKAVEFDETMHDIEDEYSEEFVGNLVKFDKQIDLVSNLLDRMDESCKQVLSLFYIEKTRLAEIARQMNWKADYAKSKVYLCRVKLRETLEQDPEFMNLVTL